MAMTLLDYQELLRNLPQAQVVGAAKTGDPRSWMAADELKRRQEMRDAEKAELAVQEQSPRNVVEEYVSMASPVPGMQPPGPGAMPGMPQAPPSPMGPQGPPMGPQGPPMRPPGPPMGPPMPPQGFQRGGPIHPNARRLSHLGRGGDTALMHVRPRDVNERATSINPQTGLPEALPLGGMGAAGLGMGALWLLRRFGPQALSKISPSIAKKLGMKGAKATTETLQKTAEKMGGFSGGVAAGEVLPVGPGGAMVKIPGGGSPPPSAARSFGRKAGTAALYGGAALGGAGIAGLGGEGGPGVTDPKKVEIVDELEEDPSSPPGTPTASRITDLQERIQAASPGMTRMPEWLGGGELPLDQWGKQLTEFGSTLATTPGEFGEGFGAALGAAGRVPEQMRAEERASLAEEIGLEKMNLDNAIKLAIEQSKRGGVMTFGEFLELMIKNTEGIQYEDGWKEKLFVTYMELLPMLGGGALPGRGSDEWKIGPDGNLIAAPGSDAGE